MSADEGMTKDGKLRCPCCNSAQVKVDNAAQAECRVCLHGWFAG